MNKREALSHVRKVFESSGTIHCGRKEELEALKELAKQVVYKGIKTFLYEYNGKLYNSYTPYDHGLKFTYLGDLEPEHFRKQREFDSLMLGLKDL